MIFRGLAEERAFIHSMFYFKIVLEKPEPERYLLGLHCFDPAIEMLLLNKTWIMLLGCFMSLEICHDFPQ